MIPAENLITLLSTVSKQSTEHHCCYYIDSLNNLLRQNPNFCSEDESTFIRKLLLWEININDDTPHSLIPIFCPGYEKYSLEELLSKCFDTNEITLLIKLSNNNTLNSEVLARINDILWCFKHQNQETKKKRITFAKNAIQHYYISANQQKNRDYAITRLARSAKLASSIQCKLPDELLQSIVKKLDPNDPFDGTLKLLQVLGKSKSNLKEELLKINQALLDNNYPSPKMNNECLTAYYDFFIQHIDNQLLKNLYREKKIESLLWFVDWEEGKGHHPMALSHAMQAEQELNKLKTTEDIRRDLRTKIEENKKKNNKLPQAMQWHYYATDISTENIQDKLKKTEHLPFTDIIKIILIDFKNIDYKTINNSLGVFHRTSTLLTSDESGALIHDEKPKLISYPDSDLIRIYSMRRIMRNEISIKISIWLGIIRNRSHENDFSLLEKHLAALGLNERKEIILNSIKYAIFGDRCTALHLIIPQVEEFFRIKIQSNGIDTSVFTHENNLEELSITQIFQNDSTAKILMDEYGHDIFCEFYLILLDKRCGNYRNKVCHGRMNIADFHSEESLYAWGLCLYAIFKELIDTTVQQIITTKKAVINEE